MDLATDSQILIVNPKFHKNKDTKKPQVALRFFI